ncbi:MFS transporter [Rubrobacter tropicus]|uniref:MFS transporter n=1 Tax=Rubrobacter tropicus TaxID=2653851 RepID=A0A6G8QDV7_9ACTN|nr:MFS transporter [Rubrobacter tropicus]QIN84659.1 MFS transporter [Rubrobacter tropicus]
MQAYRYLLALPGAPAMVAAGFLGRLPMSMRSLGCLLMVSALTGSYALAGAAVAAFTLTQAAFSPALGRLADNRGQGLVILASLVVHVCGVLGLVFLTRQEAPAWALLVAAAVVGASALSLGPLVRARWTALVKKAAQDDPDQPPDASAGTPGLSTAYALESVLDEVIYVAGPALVTALAVGVAPEAGLLGALVLVTVGSLALAAQKSTEPTVARRSDTRGAAHLVGGVVRERGMWVVVAVFAAFGAFLAAVDIGVVAFAREQGSPAAAGLLLALVGAGSLVSGLAYGALPAGVGPGPRFLLSTLVLVVGAVPLCLANSVALMAPCAAVAGLAISPTLISGYMLVESLVPPESLTESFAWISSAIAVGTAAGAAAGGPLADSAGALGTFLLSAGAAAAALLINLAGRRSLRAAAGAGG